MRIAFISTMDSSPWGGSEELWSKTAIRLSHMGHRVSASVVDWPEPHPRVRAMADQGVAVRTRPRFHPLWQRGLSRLGRARPALAAFEKLFNEEKPDLVVISCGGPFPPPELLELCLQYRLRFVTITHAVGEHVWPNGEDACRLRRLMRSALRCYFVSRGNLRLAEKQLGERLLNAQI